MKKQWISLSFLASSVLVFSQELPKSENYIHSRVYLEETQETNAAKKQLETVAYYDGLGRPKQNIGVKTSPKGRDVVTHIEYDEFGRQAKDFLPIPQSGTQAGRIYDSPLSNASSIYGNEKIFSEKILENSPLNRLLGQIHQGNDWQNHPIRIEYEANTVSDRVKKFKTVTQWNGGATLSSLSQEGVFSSSSLYKNITEDEDGNTSIEFKNGQEQVVLVRKFNGSETADTYYIYNEYNQLAFVISPLAAEKANLTQDDLDRLCYQYRYDGKGRLVEKKLPAKGWEYMVYDKLDRLTMSQDAGQRAKKEWLFTRYDRFGRVAYTGIATGESRAVEQANLNLTLSNHVERTPNAGFTQNNMKVYYNPAIGGEISYPKNIKKLLSVNYYDEYPPDAPAAPENILGQPLMASAPAGGKSTKSLPLAVYLKNIENDDWSRTFTYYDQKARVIGTLHHNYLVGYTQIQMELDFAGVVQKTHTYHKRDTKSPEVKIEERFVYDHQNRLVKHFHKINGGNEELLLENIYDELGRLSKKKVGGSEGSPLQEVDYAYNIRGWLTSVNQPQNLGKDLFGFELKYQNPVSNGKDTPKYNGNISQMDWKTRSNNEELRRYTYQYDDLNRLTKSFYSKPLAVQPNTGSYDEYLSYDVNGNIKTLSRFGDMDKPQAVKIDELSYTYIGNQLVKVSDNSQNPSGYPIGGGVIPYDENGNMMNHNDKGISYIGYNHLNLPSAVFWNGKQTFYLYRADGVKVKKDFPGKVTDYLDGFQYENGALQFVPTAEGYYDFIKQRYVYNYTDHLGNVRLSYYKGASGLIVDKESNYYPFGLEHKGYNNSAGNSAYRYSYQGQERQEDTNWLAFKWRNYDPTIGRFFNVDPLSENFPYNSTYAIQENKMGLGIEFEGLELLKNHSGFFAIKGNEVLVKKAPSTQKNDLGQPTFSAGNIGLSTKGYFPDAPRIVASNTGLRLEEYKYNSPTPNAAQMQDTPDKISGKDRQSFKTMKKKSEMWNLKQVSFDRTMIKVDGINEILGLITLGTNIPNLINSTNKYVQATKDIDSILEQAKIMGNAMNYVDKSGIKMNQEMRNNVVNYIFDGTLPTSGLMQNSEIIHYGWQIMKNNNIAVQSLNEQTRNKKIYE